MNQSFQYITFNPEILNGKPIIRNTRISVEMILEWLASGGTPEEIVKAYPFLSKEAVREAIQYAAYSVRNDQYIEVALA